MAKDEKGSSKEKAGAAEGVNDEARNGPTEQPGPEPPPVTAVARADDVQRPKFSFESGHKDVTVRPPRIVDAGDGPLFPEGEPEKWIHDMRPGVGALGLLRMTAVEAARAIRPWDEAAARSAMLEPVEVVADLTLGLVRPVRATIPLLVSGGRRTTVPGYVLWSFAWAYAMAFAKAFGTESSRARRMIAALRFDRLRISADDRAILDVSEDERARGRDAAERHAAAKAHRVREVLGDPPRFDCADCDWRHP